jgi:hypothetical protein
MCNISYFYSNLHHDCHVFTKKVQFTVPFLNKNTLKVSYYHKNKLLVPCFSVNEIKIKKTVQLNNNN